MRSTPNPRRGLTRRELLLSSGVGLACAGAGTSLSWLAFNKGVPLLYPSFSGKSVEVKKPQFAMPGPFPGRVVEVNHPAAVSDENAIHPGTVHEMMNRGMCELTGADLPKKPAAENVFAAAAWRRFFEKGDVVGIKVNPVGRKSKPGEDRPMNAVGSISSPAVVIEIVCALKEIGIPPKDIIIFERYANEFRDAGYERMMLERELQGVRWCASSSRYKDPQLDIEGFDEESDRGDRHVVGYDPDHFALMEGFCDPATVKTKDERRFRSHLSMVVTRMVNKFITIPVLKDHRSAGVTLALKNLSHGFNNNVARSHLPGVERIDGVTGPNQCNTFIPTAVNQRPTREKATLHILDGLIGVYEGGPGNWNSSWATWRRKSLFFATDPVAMDMVGWPIIDAERKAHGLPPVQGAGSEFKISERTQEQFDWRTPQHILLAGNAGLGVFDHRGIDHRCLKLGSSS